MSDPLAPVVHEYVVPCSAVSVEFVGARDGCTMRFAHGGWTDANAAVRPKFGDWRVILDRYAALVQV